jgi:two-component system sensor histidine kinase PilS (NtrC family)
MDKGSNNVLFVRLEKNDDEIKLKIRDNGCGMKEDTRKRLFEPFHTTKPKGTGLGLAITHKILESHGAKVFVESELNRGTEFTLSFHERV